MHYKNIHAIYFSPTHTSSRIAHALIEGMRIQAFHESDITFRKPETVELLEDELTIVAVPVYAGRVAPTALERLRMFEGKNSPVIPIVLYGNRDYEDALIELCDLLTRQGFTLLAAGAFIGEHTYSRPGFPIAEGRPDEKDHDIACHFGAQALEKLESVNSVEELAPLAVRGNRPYREVKPATPQAPVVDQEICVQCGHCTEVCPVGAMQMGEAGVYSDPAICIKCCACVKECPAGALTFDTPYTQMLSKNFSARKEPELFL